MSRLSEQIASLDLKPETMGLMLRRQSCTAGFIICALPTPILQDTHKRVATHLDNKAHVPGSVRFESARVSRSPLNIQKQIGPIQGPA